MPGKKLYFGTNLKMYKGIRETVSYLCELEQLTADMDPENVQLFVIPSYTSLPSAPSGINRFFWAPRICAGRNRDSLREKFPR